MNRSLLLPRENVGIGVRSEADECGNIQASNAACLHRSSYRRHGVESQNNWSWNTGNHHVPNPRAITRCHIPNANLRWLPAISLIIGKRYTGVHVSEQI